MKKNQLFFLTIFIEGYVVLACELLAIRQLIPFVGSGTETISIIISGVLLPLAIGYHAGGHAYRRMHSQARQQIRQLSSVRKILLKNILISLAILTPGLSYVFLEFCFAGMVKIGVTNRLLQTALYSVCFISVPIFLLAQTVPLISNYFSKKTLSEITGKMLLFSTTGSFFGSVFSTVVLMSTIGVHNTVIVTIGLLCLMALFLNRQEAHYFTLAGLFALSLFLNNDEVMHSLHIVSDDAYNMVKVIDQPKEGTRLMSINRSYSSLYSPDPEKRFAYLKYIEKNFITPANQIGKPLDVLVIGAGGFTVGMDDPTNHYTYVDIDKALKDDAEKYFLKQKLSPNKQFIVSSAREYVHNSKLKYDLIVLDVFTNVYSIPMEVVTRNFLQDVKARLKPGGIVIANIIDSAYFHERFSVRYDNTFASVFPNHSRQVINPFNPWNTASREIVNVLYIYYDTTFMGDQTIYTDDKNTYSMDRP